MKEVKLVCFDVDGTLIDFSMNSYSALADGLGWSSAEAFVIFEQAKKGEVCFREAEKFFVKEYSEGGNANRFFIKEIFNKKVKIPKEAKDLVFYLKEKGYLVYLISGSIDIFVEIIAQKIKADGFYANASMEFDDRGYLKKINYRENQGEIKVEQLKELIKKLGIDMSQVVFVGDAKNDIEAFKITKQGIAINSSNEELKRIAWKRVNSLEEIKTIL